MSSKKRGQISTEYLIIVAFVTFVVIGALGLAYIYTAEIKDTIKINQIENFANKLISSSESIFYAGEPSTITMTGYIPDGVTDIQINGKEIVFTVETNSGTNVMAFISKVEIEGSILPSSGVKKLQLVAEEDKVVIY
jgi:uncharacterized protein (UPF0333 family)